MARRNYVPPRYQALLDGTMKISDLDDEELLRGKLRAIDGTFKGRDANLIPRKMHQAVVRELVHRVEGGLLVDLKDMYEVLKSIANNPRAPAVARNQAAIYVIERVSGKTPDKVEIRAEVRKFEELVEGGLLMDLEVEPKQIAGPPDPNIVDAEIVEEPTPRKPVRRKKAS